MRNRERESAITLWVPRMCCVRHCKIVFSSREKEAMEERHDVRATGGARPYTVHYRLVVAE